MTTAAPATRPAINYDLKDAVSSNRLAGLWAMGTGFRLRFLGATVSLAIGASAKTATYLLLRYFVDNVLGKERAPGILGAIAAGFIGLALIEGGFTFLSGRLAAQTAEGIARRLRNYLYDHIQRLTFAYHDRMQTGELIQRSRIELLAGQTEDHIPAMNQGSQHDGQELRLQPEAGPVLHPGLFLN